MVVTINQLINDYFYRIKKINYQHFTDVFDYIYIFIESIIIYVCHIETLYKECNDEKNKQYKDTFKRRTTEKKYKISAHFIYLFSFEKR